MLKEKEETRILPLATQQHSKWLLSVRSVVQIGGPCFPEFKRVRPSGGESRSQSKLQVRYTVRVNNAKG